MKKALISATRGFYKNGTMRGKLEFELKCLDYFGRRIFKAQASKNYVADVKGGGSYFLFDLLNLKPLWL